MAVTGLREEVKLIALTLLVEMVEVPNQHSHHRQ